VPIRFRDPVGFVASEGSWVTCTIEGCGRICGAKFDIRHATLW
jgi:hypothetical protein